ncbi:hypothetical protein WA026_020433 [Henosepilachna vigintioctopunctata]|uniref:Uncharacterized protein n=1 Tax=Henosepilachna vigintioctopunctata TaxID=420089 RepID=A0AAW1UR62_9CUCU
MAKNSLKKSTILTSLDRIIPCFHVIPIINYGDLHCIQSTRAQYVEQDSEKEEQRILNKRNLPVTMVMPSSGLRNLRNNAHVILM